MFLPVGTRKRRLPRYVPTLYSILTLARPGLYSRLLASLSWLWYPTLKPLPSINEKWSYLDANPFAILIHAKSGCQQSHCLFSCHFHRFLLISPWLLLNYSLATPLLLHFPNSSFISFSEDPPSTPRTWCLQAKHMEQFHIQPIYHLTAALPC